MNFFSTAISFFKDKNYRELWIATMIIIALGTVVYHYLEGWRWIDCLYFSVITLTTIGFGDFAPQTDGGKLFTIFYIPLGIGIIFGFLNAIFHHYKDIRYIGDEPIK